MTEIAALRRRAGHATDFLLTASEQFIEPRNYYERYQRMLRKAGLPPHSFHALRHTFATRCIENGLDPKSVSELLGHANVRITLERYVHPSLEGKRKFLERFSPAIGVKMEGVPRKIPEKSVFFPPHRRVRYFVVEIETHGRISPSLCEEIRE